MGGKRQSEAVFLVAQLPSDHRGQLSRIAHYILILLIISKQLFLILGSKYWLQPCTHRLTIVFPTVKDISTVELPILLHPTSVRILPLRIHMSIHYFFGSYSTLMSCNFRTLNLHKFILSEYKIIDIQTLLFSLCYFAQMGGNKYLKIEVNLFMNDKTYIASLEVRRLFIIVLNCLTKYKGFFIFRLSTSSDWQLYLYLYRYKITWLNETYYYVIFLRKI